MGLDEVTIEHPIKYANLYENDFVKLAQTCIPSKKHVSYIFLIFT